jgi:hypothetical protein
MAAMTSSHVVGAVVTACSDVDDSRIVRAVAVRRDVDARDRAEDLLGAGPVRRRSAVTGVGTDAAGVDEAERRAPCNDEVRGGAPEALTRVAAAAFPAVASAQTTTMRKARCGDHIGWSSERFRARLSHFPLPP